MVQNWSKYQVGIFDAIKNTDNNIIVNAVAGSGKTTTIVEACKRLNKPSDKVQFLAFNKAIAVELSAKLKGYATVNTLHSFGLSILRSAFQTSRYNRISIDNKKYFKYIQQNIFDLSSHITRNLDNIAIFNACKVVKQIFDLARVNLIDYEDKNALESLCDNYGIMPKYDEINVAATMLKSAYRMPSDLTIDFTDMVVLPLFYSKYVPTFDYVFIDECQDLNTAQRELMLLAAKKGRFIAVGDRNQAINGFCGADCSSFDKIASVKNTIELPLSVNYRCGTNIIHLAQSIVPQITACNSASCGIVEHKNVLSRDLFHKHDMVLCRKTAPLVGLCLKMIQSGITAVIKGSDIADSMKTLINSANVSSVDELKKWVREQKMETASNIASFLGVKIETAKKTKKYTILSDRLDCIEQMCTKGISSVSDIKEYINEMFDEKHIKDAVVLSTAHKSKGLESERVILLTPNTFSFNADVEEKKKGKKKKAWELQQELNLTYVALTRAKKELVILDIDENGLKKAEIK